MEVCPLSGISPLDGRYYTKLISLRPIASEFGLIYYRLIVEIRWLLRLSVQNELTGLPKIDTDGQLFLENLIQNFDLTAAEQIKAIEKTTNHDVKAIEYYLHEQFKTNSKLSPYIPFIHFGCTSEDINNLAYGLMLAKIRAEILTPAMEEIIHQLSQLAESYAELPMLSRTHGQAATPTTLGKELTNFIARLTRQLQIWKQLPILGKMNGATGNFNAHKVAAPEINWPALSQEFILV